MDPLPMILATLDDLDGAVGVAQCRRGRTREAMRERLEASLRQVWYFVQQAFPLWPWALVFILAGSWTDWTWSEGRGAGATLDCLHDHQLVLSFALLLVAFPGGGAPSRDYAHARRGEQGSSPALAALAFLLWNLGLVGPRGMAPCAEKWRLAAVESVKKLGPAHAVDHHTAAMGLILLDDALRTVLRFVAQAAPEAWPFALINRKSHTLWVNDEDWWEACYTGVGWMKLPRHPKHSPNAGVPQTGPWCLLKEAMLWASMVLETLGMMAILPPKFAAPCWALAPCVASTLLVVSCAPWLPRQSDMVLVEMRQLLRAVGRFAIYFQAAWAVVVWLLLLHPDESLGLRATEAAAFIALHFWVLGRLWVVTSRCRAASPLYAVAAEDFVSDTLPHSRPLYCGNLGVVEGSHAPTRMCDWDAISSADCGLRWRDRCAMRRCAESLAAREAHLLSHLDALSVRISEAEMEAHSARCSSGVGGGSSGDTTPSSSTSSPRCFILVLALSAAVVVPLAVLFVIFATGTLRTPFSRQERLPSAPSFWEAGSGALQGLLWASLLLRVAQGWHASVVAMWNASTTGQLPTPQHIEVGTMRERASTLTRSLAETQYMLCRLEDQFDRLQVAVERHRGRDVCAVDVASSGASPGVAAGLGAAIDSWRRAPMSMRALLVGWMGSFFVAWSFIFQPSRLHVE
eukprot:TRINITY_DN9705_c2_g1_i1.p1 TRINITY_DN9705_c2_g1~~TRINITY_DN9705_c2_g1_i1.p1  ORF type:complete len:728 (+),score=108.87 TRINITY_DN9705_c2_g1_i1:126-2186(+)